MNEQELKNLWQADQTAPTIDFAAIQKTSDEWHKKLRRKVRVDIWAQILVTAAILVSIIFYPKMIFLAIYGLFLCIWYVRELRGLYKSEIGEQNNVAVKHSLNTKLQTMKSYFRRTRIATYGSVPPILITAFYGLNFFDDPSVTFAQIVIGLIFILILCEISVVIVTEIYFVILYKPALNELKNLLRQLNSEE